jgi:hypothetical protein
MTFIVPLRSSKNAKLYDIFWERIGVTFGRGHLQDWRDLDGETSPRTNHRWSGWKKLKSKISERSERMNESIF